MNETNVRLLMSLMGCRVGTLSKKGWLRGSCPFAPWLHSKGKDARPSFAIKVETDGESHFRCYSCNTRGSLKQLVWRYEREIGRQIPELESLILRADTVSLQSIRERIARSSYGYDTPASSSSSFDSSLSPNRPTLAQTVREIIEGKGKDELPEELLQKFKGAFTPEALTYLKGPKPQCRGLRPSTIEAWELGYHRGSHRIVIPLRDWNGRLVNLSGRDIRKYPLCPRCGDRIPKDTNRCDGCGWRKPPKFLHKSEFKRDWYLFGENKINPKIRRGILVEGFFDVMDLWQRGYENIVADMGSYLSVVQMEKLFRFFDMMVLVPDGDPAGEAAVNRIREVLSNRMMVLVAKNIPEGKDPDQLDDSFLRTFLGPPTRLDNDGRTC